MTGSNVEDNADDSGADFTDALYGGAKLITRADDHQPGAKWEFNDDVAAKFDNMLSRSIPHYGAMRELTYRLGSKFIESPSTVVDFGASRGEASAAFIKNLPHNDYTMTEVSAPMMDVMTERFKEFPNVSVLNYDLRQPYSEIARLVHNPNEVADPKPTRLVLSILTLIFIPINFRQSIIQGIYNGMADDGAFLFVEKVLGNSALMQELLVDAYHEYKFDHGYSWEDIERKRASLEGVQVPIRHEDNISMLRSAGFRHVETYYRSMNFCGYIAIK